MKTWQSFRPFPRLDHLSDVKYFFRSRCLSGECYPLSVSLNITNLAVAGDKSGLVDADQPAVQDYRSKRSSIPPT